MSEKWELFCEELYKMVTIQVKPYIKENMTEVEKIIAKTKTIPSIKADVNNFCKKNDISSLDVISKLRTMLEDKDGDQYTIVEEILDCIENSIQLQEKEIE